jgi:hypothetical protein
MLGGSRIETKTCGGLMNRYCYSTQQVCKAYTVNVLPYKDSTASQANPNSRKKIQSKIDKEKY